MRVLFVIPGMGFGGAERVVATLANELVKSNDITVVLTSGKGETAYKLDENVKLEIMPVSGNVVKTWGAFRRLCKRQRPDAVVAFMADTGVMAAAFLAGTGIPVIASERNDPARKRGDLSVIVKLLGRIAPAFTAGYVFQSEGARSYYPKRVQKKSRIILNPLNIEKLPAREADKIDNRIVSVGRLHPQKNQKMLINAFAKSKAKDAHTLHIYGDGELRGELEALIDKLGISDKVFLEGNSKRVQEDIKNAKMFVFTSDYEGLPNALMEAMAIGIPCLSTDCSPGGARMLINDGENGVLIPCGDEERLIAELDALIDDPERLKAFSEQSVKLRDRTNIAAISKEWIDFIKKFAKHLGE